VIILKVFLTINLKGDVIMPVKKKRTTKKLSSTKSTAKKPQTNPLIETENLQREIIKSQDKLEKTYAKFLAQFKKQRDRFRTKIKQAKEKFSNAKTSCRKSNIKTMIKALEEKKQELTLQLETVSNEYKKFLAQQKTLQKFEKDYNKKNKEKTKKKSKNTAKKIRSTKKSTAKTTQESQDFTSSELND
jgi:hypothetical protein